MQFLFLFHIYKNIDIMLCDSERDATTFNLILMKLFTLLNCCYLLLNPGIDLTGPFPI